MLLLLANVLIIVSVSIRASFFHVSTITLSSQKKSEVIAATLEPSSVRHYMAREGFLT
jgi:hypothetical protein